MSGRGVVIRSWVGVMQEWRCYIGPGRCCRCLGGGVQSHCISSGRGVLYEPMGGVIPAWGGVISAQGRVTRTWAVLYRAVGVLYESGGGAALPALLVHGALLPEAILARAIVGQAGSYSLREGRQEHGGWELQHLEEEAEARAAAAS